MSQSIKKALQIKEITPAESMDEPHFFNSNVFLLNKPFNVQGWQLICDQPIAQIFFYLKDDVAISGYQATFGSFDVKNNMSQLELTFFIKEIIELLKMRGVKRMEIKNAPSYFSSSRQIEEALTSCGFNLQLLEINQQIKVNEQPFLRLAKRNVRKKINQGIHAGFTFNIEPNTNISEIYNLVVATRNRKKYGVSMTLPDLTSAIESCPESYILFTLRDGAKLIAASVSIIINSDVVYNFYHADHFEYRAKSPLSLLVKYIYEYCQQNKYKVLDLGISTMNGILNSGLFTFKENLGAVTSEKKSFSLTL